METKKSVNQLGMFDFAKGIGMIFVVLGHVLGYYTFKGPILLLLIPFVYVRYGIMQMFFITGGYNFRKRDVLKTVKQQFGFYIKPYLVLAPITVFTYTIVHYLTFCYKEGAIKEGINMAMTFLCGISNPSTFLGYTFNYGIVAVWFFIAMFIGWNLLNIIMRINNKTISTVIVIMVVISGYVLSKIGTFPWCLSQGLIATGYIYIGHIMKKKKVLEKKIPPLIMLMLIVVSVLGAAFGYVDMAYNTWKLGMLDVILGAVAGFLMIKLCLIFNDFDNILVNGIKTVGKYTFLILPIHCFEMMVYHWGQLAKKFVNYPFIGFLVQSIISIAIIIVGILFVGVISHKKERG